MPLAGASNINFGAARNRGTLNLNTTPGGQLVKYNSPLNPNLKPFAEPPTQLNLKPQLQLNPASPRPLPNLAELPKYQPVKPTVNTGTATTTAAATKVVVTAGGVASTVSASNLGTLAALIWASNVTQLYKLWGLSQPESKPVEKFLNGGQNPGTYYSISGYVVELCANKEDFSDGVEVEFYWEEAGIPETGEYLLGPVEVLPLDTETLRGGHFNFGIGIRAANRTEIVGIANNAGHNDPQGYRTRPWAKTLRGSFNAIPQGQKLPDSKPQMQRKPAPQPTLEREPLPRFAEPELELKTPKPQLKLIPNLKPLPDKQPIRLQVPSDRRITINFPGQAPIQIQQPQLQTTNPEPTTLTIPRNAPVGQPQPIQVQQPGMQPVTLTSPSTDPFMINIPGFEPITVDPKNNSRPGGVVGNPLQPRMFVPTPLVATSPLTPSPLTPSPLVPSPQPSHVPVPSPQPTELPDVLIPATILATLTPMLQQLLRNTSPAAMQPLMAGAVCQTTQPGGCMTNLVNDATNKAGDNLFNKLSNLFNTGANAAQLALLPIINNKLGDQVPGGLSGFLGRLSKSLGVDRALNLIAIASNLHNAMMLSASLKITLLEVLSSVGNATGLLQTSEGDNVDLNAVFNQGIEKFMTLLLGEENYAGLKVGLRKYNAIYRAATNSLNAVSSMFSSIGQAVETGAEYTGKIGNAIRSAGVVRENAYNYMAEKFEVRNSNKFIAFQSQVGNTIEVLETVNEIAENVVEGQQQYTEAVKATADFQKQLSESQKNPGVDNKAIKEEAEKIKANLVKDPTGEDETGLLSFLTD